MISFRKGEFITSTQNDKENTKVPYFQKLLKEAKVVLIEDDSPHVLFQEQSLVIRDISKLIKDHEAYPNNVQEFTNDFKKHCECDEKFQKALANTIFKKQPTNLDDPEIKVSQESIIRILLNIEDLQTEMIDMILEKVTTCVAEEDEICWISLLLNSLKYLSHIQNSKDLASKLLDILEIATYPNQIEILNSIPEIFPYSQYDNTASQLSKLLETNKNLTTAILDCLNSLTLSKEIRTDIQYFILDNLLSCCDHKMFPILFEFLVTDCKPDSLQNILFKCRECLDSIVGSESSDKEIESNKVIILNKLYICSCIPKQLYETWMSVFNGIKVYTEHKPIDFIILIILYTTGNARKKIIESLIKKKIKLCLLKPALLDSLFQKYIVQQFLADYNNSLIEIAVSLLRHYNDMNMINFGKKILCLLFGHDMNNRIQRQELLHNLILLTGYSDKKTVDCVLSVLLELSKDAKIKCHTIQLMGLLEKLDTYELPAVKDVFEILCSLTCCINSDDNSSGLKDELHMLVRKQLSSSKKHIKIRGIVCAVVMAKYTAMSFEDQSNISIADESITAITDIPGGPAQIAAQMLDLISTCVSASAEYRGLYYDQLASMVITTANLDKYFLTWMFETITNDFQDIFVTENVPDVLYDIPISSQYSLNNPDEVEIPIHINIAGLSINPDEKKSIFILSPLFRFLRLLHYQHQNGDLASIDALLGCGVLLPAVDDIGKFDIDQVKLIVDCLFHCINWFRETVSAFVTQKNKKLRQKVIQRLQHIVELEISLKEYLEIIPDHKLPPSYFHAAAPQLLSKPSSPQKSPKPRKKLKSRTIVLEQDTTIASTAAAEKPKTASKKLTMKDIYIPFRELDIDIILLLKYPLKPADNEEAMECMPSSTQVATQNPTTINLIQFNFLLNDFVLKLNTITKTKTNDLSNLTVIDPVDVITDSAKLLPYIARHFYQISMKLESLVDKSPDSHELYTDKITLYKKGYNLILECYARIFAWPGFQNPKSLQLLKDCLISLRTDEQTQLNSANRMIVDFVDKISKYVESCFYLPSAVNIIQIMQSLYTINMSTDVLKKIAATSGKLLAKRWFNLKGNLDNGKAHSENVEILAKAYLNGASVKTICGLVASVQEHVSDLNAKEDILQLLPTFSKTTFYILYRCLCSALLESVKLEITSLTNNQHLVLWKMTALTMQGLMMIAKVHETRSNLVCFLKRSLGVLKIFLSHGIPILEIVLRSKTDEVIEIFKTMQTSTRFLHHLCCTSKLQKDSSLIAFVPQFRLTLETLVYRVKAALVANNCSAAFWMGNLRNKNLHGEDIVSQNSNLSIEETDVGSDEELPNDDDENQADERNSEEDETASEVFD